MAVDDQEWYPFFAVLDHFPAKEALSEELADSYRVLLDGVAPEQLMSGLRRLLHSGQKWRPTAPEILAAARRDPGRPTFDEILVLLFRRGGVLDVRCRKAPTPDFPGHRAEFTDLVNERLADLHPAVSGFVARLGLDRLRTTNVDGEDGHWRRKELREAWDDYCAAGEQREVAVLAAGTGVRGLTQLDPLAALGIAPAPKAPPGLATGDELAELPMGSGS